MRRGNDRRPAKVVKRGELRRLAAGRTVTIVIDDDPAVVAALAADGWPVELADWVPYAPRAGQRAGGVWPYLTATLPASQPFTGPAPSTAEPDGAPEQIQCNDSATPRVLNMRFGPIGAALMHHWFRTRTN